MINPVTDGLAAQQASDESGGDRWLRLVDEMTGMFVDHVAPVRERKVSR
jgi:hypothetical protein